MRRPLLPRRSASVRRLDVVKDVPGQRCGLAFALRTISSSPISQLQGFYQSSGLGGNQYNLTTGQFIAPGGFGSSMSQLFGFGYPGYGGTLSLTLPVRNRGGQVGPGQRAGFAHARSV